MAALASALRRGGLIALVLGSLNLVAAATAPAATLTVTITGVRSDRGHVYVALFDKPEGFPDGEYSLQHVLVEASTAPIVVRFEDLAPGRYAVGAYHDENVNRKLDTTWIGLPNEGYALSRGVRAVVSRPRFADAAFPVPAAGAAITLHIQY